MKLKKIFALLPVLALSGSVYASGFSLYQPSVISHAMGGALVGRAMDASANFNNPATLSDLTNIVVTIGFITEHPRGELRGRRDGTYLGDMSMDPGMFMLPHFQLAVPLPFDFTFGLGMSPDYGLGTVYSETGPLAWNARETTVQSLVLNPNLAYRITDKWSVAAGLRWMYFDFEQYKSLSSRQAMPEYMSGADWKGEYHLKGDNRAESIGWQVGTKYDILDNLAVGVVYKSAIDVTVRGTTEMNSVQVSPYGPVGGMIAQQVRQTLARRNGEADADLTLPQSITGGLNWDITPVWHFGMAVSWTEWSEFDTLVFNVKPTKMPIRLNWKDTWRYSWGVGWDFHEDWTWMLSYVYDMDCTDSTQESTMLPPAARHIATTGFTWRCWRGLEFSLSYSCIFMHGNSMTCYNAYENNARYDLEVSRGFCHAGGFSITYRF